MRSRATAASTGWAALLLAGCLLRDDDGPAAPPVVPLAVGNAWEYVDSAYYGPDSVGIDSTRIDVRGARAVTIGGAPQTVYLWNVRDRATGLPGALTLYVANRRDGEYTLGAVRDTAEFLFETLHVKHPGKRGERYVTYFLDLQPQGDGYAPVLDTVEIEVAVPDTTCVTPAGVFACTEYRGRQAGNLFARTWYAPGVGYLGSETTRDVETDGGTRHDVFRKRLVSYTLR